MASTSERCQLNYFFHRLHQNYSLQIRITKRKEASMMLVDKLKLMNHALTVTELAKMLHLGKTAVYDMVRREAIPCIRLGYSVRFDPQEIAEWLHQHRMVVRERSRSGNVAQSWSWFHRMTSRLGCLAETAMSPITTQPNDLMGDLFHRTSSSHRSLFE